MIPWKFISFIVLLVCIIFFLGFNASNKAEIRYWFGKDATNPYIEDGEVLYENDAVNELSLPVYLPLFIAFLAGVVVTLPLVFKKKIEYVALPKKKNKKEANGSSEQQPQVTLSEQEVSFNSLKKR